MLKQNDWYFLPTVSTGKNPIFENAEILGSLTKIIKVKDNPNYVDVESWFVTQDRRFIHNGILEDMDSVLYSKFGKKVQPPPKVFEVLYGESVKPKVTVDQVLDTENEYSDYK